MMPLTTTTNFDESIARADNEIRFRVTITDGTTTLEAMSGSMQSYSDLSGYPTTVQSVSSISSSIDPFTRAFAIDEMQVSIDFGWIRPIIASTFLKGQRCAVHIGTSWLNQTEFVDYFAGTIEEIRIIDTKTVVLTVLSIYGLLDDNKIVGYFRDKHPLEMIYNGVDALLDKADVSTSYIDTVGLDPSLYTDISHLLIARVDDSEYSTTPPITAKTKVLDLIEQAASYLNGYVLVGEDGKITYRHYDVNDAVVDAWTNNEWIADSFKQQPLERNIVNELIVKFGLTWWKPVEPPDANEEMSVARHAADMAEWSAYPYERSSNKKAFAMTEANSQTDYAESGSTNRVISKSFAASWSGELGQLTADINASATNMLVHKTNGLQTFCGNRVDAWGTVTAGRPMYLYITDDVDYEIVKVTSVTYPSTSTSLNAVRQIRDPENGTDTQLIGIITSVTVNTMIRSQLGTTAPAAGWHGGYVGAFTTPIAFVYDITAYILLFESLLPRFAHGCNFIELDTTMEKYKYQINDMISVTNPDFIAKDFADGLSAQKFQIIGKEVDLYANPPVIHWTLADTGISATSTSITGSWGRVAGRRFQASLRESMSTSFIEGTMVVADGGGFDVDIGSGTAADGDESSPWMAGTTLTVAASKDTYIYVKASDGSIMQIETGLGAGAPTQGTLGVAFLAKVVSDGSGIVSIDTSNQDTTALKSFTQMASKSFDDVDHGATWRKLQSVDGSNQAVAESVANQVVDDQHVYQKTVRVSLNPNPTLLRYR